MNTHPNLPPLPEVPENMDEYWLRYVHPKLLLCSLCGNSGVIDTRRTAISGVGVNAGRLNFCICPNGIAKREAEAVREPAADHVVEPNKMVGGEVVETLAERITYALLPDASEDTVRRVERMIREGEPVAEDEALRRLADWAKRAGEPAPARVGGDSIQRLVNQLNRKCVKAAKDGNTQEARRFAHLSGKIEEALLAAQSGGNEQPPTTERANH